MDRVADARNEVSKPGSRPSAAALKDDDCCLHSLPCLPDCTCRSVGMVQTQRTSERRSQARESHPYLFGTIETRVCLLCSDRVKLAREAIRVINRGGELRANFFCEAGRALNANCVAALAQDIMKHRYHIVTSDAIAGQALAEDDNEDICAVCSHYLDGSKRKIARCKGWLSCGKNCQLAYHWECLERVRANALVQLKEGAAEDEIEGCPYCMGYDTLEHDERKRMHEGYSAFKSLAKPSSHRKIISSQPSPPAPSSLQQPPEVSAAAACSEDELLLISNPHVLTVEATGVCAVDETVPSRTTLRPCLHRPTQWREPRRPVTVRWCDRAGENATALEDVISVETEHSAPGAGASERELRAHRTGERRALLRRQAEALQKGSGAAGRASGMAKAATCANPLSSHDAKEALEAGLALAQEVKGLCWQ